MAAHKRIGGTNWPQPENRRSFTVTSTTTESMALTLFAPLWLIRTLGPGNS